MIAQSTARMIAADWHGGQSTNLYSFSSTGIVRDLPGLLREIKDCHQYATLKERKRLAMLTDFLLWD